MSTLNLMAYHDGELGPAERSQVELHLTECPECRSQLEEWRTVDRLARGEGPSQVVGRLRSPGPQSWRFALRAALLLLALGLIWAFKPRPAAAPEGARRYEVQHGARTYTVETSGATLLMVDVEDEQGRAQAHIGGES